jgi:hypothetical protein
VASFLLRASVDRVIRGKICEKHQQGKSTRKKSKKEKRDANICTSVGIVDDVDYDVSGKGDNRFKLDNFTKEDYFDFTG